MVADQRESWWCACAQKVKQARILQRAIFGRPIKSGGIGHQMGYCQGATNAGLYHVQSNYNFQRQKQPDGYFDFGEAFDKSLGICKIVRSARIYYRVQGLVMMVKFIFMTAIKISKAVGNHVMKVSNLL